MPSRVSDVTIFELAIRNIRRNRLGLERAQARVSTGRRVNVASDDPTGATRALRLDRLLGRVEQFVRNIGAARTHLSASESVLASVTDLLTRARELAVSADQETEAFDLVVPEIEQIFEEVLRLANARSGSRYLFAGFRTASAPFAASGPFAPGSPSPTVSYAGDGNVFEIEVAEGARMPVNLPGSSVFLGDEDGDGVTDAGNVDVFEVLGNLRDALRTRDGTAILAAIGDLDRALDQVVRARGILGGRLNRLELTENQLRSLRLDYEAERSSILDVDLVEAIADLRSRENTLQAALLATARVLPVDLADFLR